MATIMSMFNADTICLDCKDRERAHPLYAQAQAADAAAIRQGNYNFRGIGLPADLQFSEGASMDDTYAAIIHADQERILAGILKETSVATLTAIPGVMELVLEEYNNEILTRWEAEQEEQ